MTSRDNRIARMGSKRVARGPARTSRVLKEAILLAAEAVGLDGKGKDGLVGYLIAVAKEDPAVFCSLLARVIPLQGAVEHEHRHVFTREEAIQRLRERGIPVENLFPAPVLIEHDTDEFDRDDATTH
jgi:hypothetical protein